MVGLWINENKSANIEYILFLYRYIILYKYTLEEYNEVYDTVYLYLKGLVSFFVASSLEEMLACKQWIFQGSHILY